MANQFNDAYQPYANDLDYVGLKREAAQLAIKAANRFPYFMSGESSFEMGMLTYDMGYRGESSGMELSLFYMFVVLFCHDNMLEQYL